MSRHYPSRSHIPLHAGALCVQPRHPNFDLIDFEASALRVMTDFRDVIPQTVEPEIQIDLALQRMKYGGVRLLLVVNPAEELIGIVTATDIMSEKPIRLVKEQRIARENITVAHVMRRHEDVRVPDMRSVQGAQVGHIVETLHELRLQHILVVEVDDDSGQQRIRGLFSTSQISKQLHRDVSQDMAAADTLSEIVHASE